MFIDLSDERNRILSLQTMLRYLSFAGEDEGLRVSVSGNYDYVTENAVRQFQQSYGLPVTGITDRRTWEKIAEEYRWEQRRRGEVMIRAIPRDPNYETGMAERSDRVLLLQILLRALAIRYDYESLPPLSGVYGPSTEAAVLLIQRANGLEETGIADPETWRRISEEYNALQEQ